MSRPMSAYVLFSVRVRENNARHRKFVGERNAVKKDLEVGTEYKQVL